MNNRSLFVPWLASATAAIFIAHAFIHGHAPLPHIEQPVEVSFVFSPEFPVASGSVSASTAQLLNSYVNK